MGRYHGLIGIALILGIAFLASNNKRRINIRLVLSGIALQVIIGLLVLKIQFVTDFFHWVGRQIGHIEEFAKAGAAFVYSGVVVENPAVPSGVAPYQAPGGFVFAFSVTATIIIVCSLVAIFYYLGVMQRIVAVIAKAMNLFMRVSGVEALSNVASRLLGQVERQVRIRP